MVLPLRIDDVEHDDALVRPHRFGADDCFFPGVLLLELFPDFGADFVAFEVVQIDSGLVDVETELKRYLDFESSRSQSSGSCSRFIYWSSNRRGSPARSIEGSRGDRVAPSIDGAAYRSSRAACSSRRRIRAGVCAFRSCEPSTVFCAASIRFETIFDSIATPFSIPSRCINRLDLVAGEDAHQIVFERKEEARRARIALASGASAKLIVDAARFVTFSAEDVQAAESDYFLVFVFDDVVLPLRIASSIVLGALRPDRSPRFFRNSRAMKSGLPPSRMSVPRPAMLVAIVTAPLRPACATISASRS